MRGSADRPRDQNAPSSSRGESRAQNDRRVNCDPHRVLPRDVQRRPKSRPVFFFWEQKQKIPPATPFSLPYLTNVAVVGCNDLLCPVTGEPTLPEHARISDE